MKINLSAIVKIESDGNPKAFNKKSGARGLCQITEVCLAEWNRNNPRDRHSIGDLFNPSINQKIASWYLSKRIPEMLVAYGFEVTIENVLTAYNWGIGNLVKLQAPGNRFKPVPVETENYITKYKSLTVTAPTL